MAGSSSSVSWTPAPGRHAVNIGPSLGKVLKARKLKGSPGGATATTKRFPERDFYSFRCMSIRKYLMISKLVIIDSVGMSMQLILNHRRSIPPNLLP